MNEADVALESLRLLENDDFKKKLELSLVREDDDSQDNLNSINCTIRAIYKLSFNDYLKKNGLSLSDLDESKQFSEFRKLDAWPSQSKFVFSLQQMRDSYAQLAQNQVASKLMSKHQKEEALNKLKSKTEFWSILGEGPTAETSFRIFENDARVTELQLKQMRLLAYAFRLSLFQNKITQFKETGNFLALLTSANKELAREAFQDCTGIVPFQHDFFGGENMENEERHVEREEDNRCKKRLQIIVENVSKAIEQFNQAIQQTRQISEIIQQAINDNMEYCEHDSFEEDDFLANNEPIVHGIDLI